jgi:hypothetical protein
MRNFQNLEILVFLGSGQMVGFQCRPPFVDVFHRIHLNEAMEPHKPSTLPPNTKLRAFMSENYYHT